MRSKWWLMLLAMILLASTIRVSLSVASGPPASPRRAVERKENVVDGYGPTPDAARERALENAQERVKTLLLDRFGNRGWTLAPAQLDTDYLLESGVVQEQGEPEPTKGVAEGAIVARYKVELTRHYLEEVQRVAHGQRVQERHLVLARVLAGLVVLLLVVAGYLRLEDMTRGYATQLLRVSAFTLVALAAGVLWLTV